MDPMPLPTPPPPPPASWRQRHRLALLLVGCSLLSALVAVALYRWLSPPTERVIIREPFAWGYPEASSRTARSEMSLSASAPTDFSRAAELATPGVVFIRTYSKPRFNLFRRDEQGGNVSTGSGVVISPEGYIVTNHHVIEGGSSISVTLSDKREFSAELVGIDHSTDLALLRIAARNLPFVPLGNSDSLRVGEWVLAVGNPFNLESTVTAGIVSAKGRSIDILEAQDRIESFIQTDAAVNPGNSGGALVNTRGELVGINTAIITRSGRYEGYSFAVPANLVRKVVADLQEYGLVQRGLLGVYIDQVSADQAQRLGLDRPEGVVVTRVTPGSAAAAAGLSRGDVIVGINGSPIRTLPAMQELLGRLRPGNEVQVAFIRRGQRQQARVVLRNKLNGANLLAADTETTVPLLGATLRSLTPDERNRLQTSGVKVVGLDPGSVLARTNMEVGFIITALNDQPTTGLPELLQLLEDSPAKVVLSGLYEGYEGLYYYAFTQE